MKRDYRFWEHNLNPITMQPDPYVTSDKNIGEGAEQESDEKWVESIERSRVRNKVRRVGKFW